MLKSQTPPRRHPRARPHTVALTAAAMALVVTYVLNPWLLWWHLVYVIPVAFTYR